MAKWIAFLGVVALSSASAQEGKLPFELVSDQCLEQECQLLWSYQGSIAPTGQQLLELYRQGERYGRGTITLEEDIISRTLLMRVERRELSLMGDAGPKCLHDNCSP